MYPQLTKIFIFLLSLIKKTQIKGEAKMQDFYMKRTTDGMLIYIEVPPVKIFKQTEYTKFRQTVLEATKICTIEEIKYIDSNNTFVLSIEGKIYHTPALESYEYDKSYINMIVLDDRIKVFFPMGYRNVSE